MTARAVHGSPSRSEAPRCSRCASQSLHGGSMSILAAQNPSIPVRSAVTTAPASCRMRSVRSAGRVHPELTLPIFLRAISVGPVCSVFQIPCSTTRRPRATRRDHGEGKRVECRDEAAPENPQDDQVGRRGGDGAAGGGVDWEWVGPCYMDVHRQGMGDGWRRSLDHGELWNNQSRAPEVRFQRSPYAIPTEEVLRLAGEARGEDIHHATPGFRSVRCCSSQRRRGISTPLPAAALAGTSARSVATTAPAS